MIHIGTKLKSYILRRKLFSISKYNYIFIIKQIFYQGKLKHKFHRHLEYVMA